VDETQRVATEDDDLYHFIAYTPIGGTLYELDGLNQAPISHGPCQFSEFPQKVIPVIERRISRYPSNEIRFNLLALTKDPRDRAREIGDLETLRAEEVKRRHWLWENSLRRHNFLGFAGELMKGVVRSKLDEGAPEYEAWVKEAKSKTAGRVKEVAKRAKE